MQTNTNNCARVDPTTTAEYYWKDIKKNIPWYKGEDGLHAYLRKFATRSTTLGAGDRCDRPRPELRRPPDGCPRGQLG